MQVLFVPQTISLQCNGCITPERKEEDRKKTGRRQEEDRKKTGRRKEEERKKKEEIRKKVDES